jgi:hypothetical protein
MSKENQNQLNEMQEAFKLKQEWCTGVGYSPAKEQTNEDIYKSNERLIIENVDYSIAPVSVIEQKIKEFNEMKKRVFVDFDSKKLTKEEFDNLLDVSKEAVDGLYEIIQKRLSYSNLGPERWGQLALIFQTDYSNCQTSKEVTELAKLSLSRRWEADQEIQEFDGYLRIQEMRKRLENNK